METNCLWFEVYVNQIVILHIDVCWQVDGDTIVTLNTTNIIRALEEVRGELLAFGLHDVLVLKWVGWFGKRVLS